MTDPEHAVSDAHLPQPPHGGSFVRQGDGTLLMVDGAVEKPKVDCVPAVSSAPAGAPLELSTADRLPADPTPEQPATADEQHEG